MTRLLPLACALLFAPPIASACDDHSHAHAAAPTVSVDAASAAARATVDAFSAALKAGDLHRVEALLDADVLVLESGGAERSRKQYMAEHAGADAEFLKSATVHVLRRTARADAALAWVATESEIHAGAESYLSTETMVLRRTEAGWRIVHIHWSSHPKAAAEG